MLQWKSEQVGVIALLVKGARRAGILTIVE